jgi:hypothetical protein
MPVKMPLNINKNPIKEQTALKITEITQKISRYLHVAKGLIIG